METKESAKVWMDGVAKNITFIVTKIANLHANIAI